MTGVESRLLLTVAICLESLVVLWLLKKGLILHVVVEIDSLMVVTHALLLQWLS